MPGDAFKADRDLQSKESKAALVYYFSRQRVRGAHITGLSDGGHVLYNYQIWSCSAIVRARTQR